MAGKAVVRDRGLFAVRQVSRPEWIGMPVAQGARGLQEGNMLHVLLRSGHAENFHPMADGLSLFFLD